MFSGYNDVVRAERDKNVNETLNLLKVNNIQYSESNISNIVIIHNIHLSLKKSKGFYKYRLEGDNKWIKCRENTLIKKLSNV